MRQAYFLIVGLLSIATLFCAEQRTGSYVDEKGLFCVISKNYDVEDVGKICMLGNCMADNIGNISALAVYKKHLISMNTVFATTCNLMLSTVYHNPMCVEYMLREYISRAEEPALYAFFAASIGIAYRCNSMHRESDRMFKESLQIVPNDMSMRGLVLNCSDVHAAAYWADQHAQRRFRSELFGPEILENLRKKSNEQTGQEKSPEEFLAYARAYQPEDPMERALVEKYNSIFKKD